MFMLLVYASPILLFCLIFGWIMSCIAPSSSHEMTEIEAQRIVSKNNNYILHSESYRNGNEYYVLPQYQHVNAIMIKLAQRLDGTRNCYQ